MIKNKANQYFLRGTLILASFIILSVLAYAVEDEKEVINLYLGQTKTISVNHPTRVAIGNPEIADITEVTKDQMTITPKAAGKTTLVYWDNFGEQAYQLRVFTEDVSEVKRRVDNLLAKLDLAGVYTQAEEEEGKVFLMGRVKTPQDLERISTVLGSLKPSVVDLIVVKEEESVVEIDVLVFEIDKDSTKTLGVTWPGAITFTEASGAITNTTSLSRLFHVSDWTRTAFSTKLDLLVQEGKARVLSRPRLACQSGKEAEMLVGGEVPTFTTDVASAGGQGTSVEYKEYGIKLKIKPTVLENKRIKLALNVDVSDVGTSDSIGSATATTAKAYPTTKRTASTELLLDNGQTMTIGGLIRRKTAEDVRKVPWLGDIPIVGLLFRQRVTKTGGGEGARGNQELFIVLTPTIISQDSLLKPATQASSQKISTSAPIEPPPVDLYTSEDPINAYARDVQKRILLDLTYPEEAKAAGFQGTVKLSLHLSATGELLDTAVKESSGYKILDDWAVSTAKSIGSYPPFSPAIEEQDLWVDVPILYKLD